MCKQELSLTTRWQQHILLVLYSIMQKSQEPLSKAYTLTCEVTYLRAGLHHYKSFGYKILSEVTSVGASTFIVLLNGNLRTNCPINRDCMAALRRLFQLSG